MRLVRRREAVRPAQNRPAPRRPDKEKPAAFRMQNAGPARRAPIPFSRKRPIPLKAGAEML